MHKQIETKPVTFVNHLYLSYYSLFWKLILLSIIKYTYSYVAVFVWKEAGQGLAPGGLVTIICNLNEVIKYLSLIWPNYQILNVSLNLIKSLKLT